MQEFVTLANILADAAGEIIRKYYRTPFDVETKSDDSPVTVADRAVEKSLREIIEEQRPQDGIFGEEFGIKESQSGLVWVLDPIDGTKPFVVGRPTFGTLIALCEDIHPVLGVIDQPILKERWVGAKNMTSTMNGDKIKTRQCKSLKHAICSSTSPGMFKTMRPDFIETWRTSCDFIVWGGDCTSYGLLASGTIDLIIEADMNPYDYLALVPIITGAGGYMSDWEGKNLTMKSGERVIAAGDKSLWPEIADLIAKT